MPSEIPRAPTNPFLGLPFLERSLCRPETLLLAYSSMTIRIFLAILLIGVVHDSCSGSKKVRSFICSQRTKRIYLTRDFLRLDVKRWPLRCLGLEEASPSLKEKERIQIPCRREYETLPAFPNLLVGLQVTLGSETQRLG